MNGCGDDAIGFRQFVTLGRRAQVAQQHRQHGHVEFTSDLTDVVVETVRVAFDETHAQLGNGLFYACVRGDQCSHLLWRQADAHCAFDKFVDD